MSEGCNSLAHRPKNGRGIPRPIVRRNLPPRDPTAPRTLAADPSTGTDEHPPCTIAARVAEPTMDDEWVRRAPRASLILPPPLQFADSTPPPSPRSRPAPPPQQAPLPAHPHGLQPRGGVTPTQQEDDLLPCTSYAAVAATQAATRPPTRTTVRPTPSASKADLPHPPPRSKLPTLVVERLPDWTRHFRTIAAALGHAPNARAHGRGVIFLPKTEEESRTVQRCLKEAAASDSAISWRSTSGDSRGRRRRRNRAPRPPRAEPPAAVTPQPNRSSTARLPHRNADRVPCQARAAHFNGSTPVEAPRTTRPANPAPSSLDLMAIVQVVVEALATGMSAYLHEKVIMPVPTHLPDRRALSQDWRARAGEIPAQRAIPGK